MTTIEIVSPTYFPPKNPQIPAFHRYRPQPDPRIVKILAKKVRTSMDDSTMDKIQKTTPHPSIPLSTWTKHTELPNVWVRQQTEGTTRPRTWDDVRLTPYTTMPDISSQWSTEQARQIQQRMDEIEAITATMGGKHPMAASLHFPEVNAALRNGELPLTTMTQMTGIVDRISNRQVTQKAGFAELDQLVRPQDSTPAYHTVDFSKEETRAQRFAAIDAASKTITAFMQHIADKAGVPLSQVEQVLGKISDQQHAFITSSAASVAAVGVPGGGKSTALAGRLVNQYQQGIDVSKFEYISPTRASAHALISKVQQAAPLMKGFDTNKIQPKTPWSLGMSLLNKRTIAQGEQLVSPLQAMDKGKYANYRPMGGKSQVETNTLEDDVEKALKGGEEQYIQKLVNQYKVKNANVSELAKSFANTKNNRSLTDDYKTRLERGAKLFAQEKDTGLQSEDALFYAYVQSANMRAGFKVPGQTTPEYDRADTLHFTRKAAQQGLIKPLKGVYVDEFQGMPAEAVAMVAAITSPASHVAWAGDLSQKTVYNDDRVDEFVRRAMSPSRAHQQVNLTGTYRMDPWNAAASNARSASPNLEGHPRSAYMTSVRDRNEWGRMPTFQHEENFQKLYQGELNRWFGQMQLTMKQVHQNMQQGLSPLHGAAMTPQEAPFIFATGGHRDEFAQNLQAYLTQNLGATIGSQAYNQIYTSQTPSASSASMLHALTMDQVKGREFEAPISYVGRAGKWDPTGFDNQLFTMNSRAKGQQRFISAGQNIGTVYPTEPDYSPMYRPLPPGSMPFIQRMIDNATYQQGLPVEAIDPEFASMATHPFVPDAQNALPQNSGVLQQMAQFIKTVFSNNFYQPGVGDMPVIAPEGSIETEYDANAGEEGEKINYGKSYDLTPAGVAGDLEYKPDKGRIEHARRILQLMAAQGPKALEFVRTLNEQQTIDHDAIPSAEDLLSSKTSPFSKFGKEIELPFMTGMDRSQYIPGGVPQYGKVPEDAHGNPIRALQAIIQPEQLLNDTVIAHAGSEVNENEEVRKLGDIHSTFDEKNAKFEQSFSSEAPPDLIRQRKKNAAFRNMHRAMTSLLQDPAIVQQFTGNPAQNIAAMPLYSQTAATVKGSRKMYKGRGIISSSSIQQFLQETDMKKIQKGMNVLLRHPGFKHQVETRMNELAQRKGRSLPASDEEKALQVVSDLMSMDVYRSHPQGLASIRSAFNSKTIRDIVNPVFQYRGIVTPEYTYRQFMDQAESLRKSGGNPKHIATFEALAKKVLASSPMFYDTEVTRLLNDSILKRTRSGIIEQATKTIGDKAIYEPAFARQIVDLGERILAGEGGPLSEEQRHMIQRHLLNIHAYTDVYAKSARLDEPIDPVTFTDTMRSALQRRDPIQAHLFNTIVKEQKGDIPLESPAIQKLISERAHAPALAQKVIGTKGEALGITPAMSRISPFVTEVQNYAQRLMSTKHGGIVDPMAGVMKNGEFHPLGAGVSLGGYQKRLEEMLGRGGFEDPHAREGMQAHLAQVQQIRGILGDPSMQEQMGHFLHLASRVSTGMGADDPTLTEAQRKEAQKARNTPLDRFFAPQRNQFGSGQRSLEGVGAYLSSVMQAMEHVQRTGTIKRGHINQVLGAMGHDVNGKLFAGLRHFEKQGRFTGPEDTLSLDELLNESTKDRGKRAEEYTRYPLHPGEEVVFTGIPMGFQQQGSEGSMGTLFPAPKINYSQLQDFVKGGAYDYSELPSQRFGSAENFGNLSHSFYNLLTDEQKKAIRSAAQRDKVKDLAMATEPMYLMQQTGAMGFTTQMPVLASQVMPKHIYDRLQGGESFGSLHPSSRVVEAGPGSGALPDILPALAEHRAQRQDMLRILSLGRRIRQALSVPTTSPRTALTSQMKAQLLSSLMTTRGKEHVPHRARALQRATSTALSDAGPAPTRPTSFLNVLAPGLNPIHLYGEQQRLLPEQATSLSTVSRRRQIAEFLQGGTRLPSGLSPIPLPGVSLAQMRVSAPYGDLEHTLRGRMQALGEHSRLTWKPRHQGQPEEPEWLKEQMGQVAPEAFGSVPSNPDIALPQGDALRLMMHEVNVRLRSMADYGPVGKAIRAQSNTLPSTEAFDEEQWLTPEQERSLKWKRWEEQRVRNIRSLPEYPDDHKLTIDDEGFLISRKAYREQQLQRLPVEEVSPEPPPLLSSQREQNSPSLPFAGRTSSTIEDLPSSLPSAPASSIPASIQGQSPHADAFAQGFSPERLAIITKNFQQERDRIRKEPSHSEALALHQSTVRHKAKQHLDRLAPTSSKDDILSTIFLHYQERVMASHRKKPVHPWPTPLHPYLSALQTQHHELGTLFNEISPHVNQAQSASASTLPSTPTTPSSHRSIPHVAGMHTSSVSGDPNAAPSTEDIMRDIHRWNRQGNLARGIYPPSDEQLGVLNDPSHHKIIEGGPGGGKTATVDRAIMDLIASGEVHPNQVKLLSAMHSGTEALNKGFDPYRDLMPKGHQYQFNPAQTFHSLAAEIVLRQDEHGNYPVLQQLGLAHLTGNILEEPNEDARESMTPEQWNDALTRAPSTHYQAFMVNRGLSISREEALKHLTTINEIKNQRGTPDSAYDAMMLQGRATLTDPNGPMTQEARLALYEQGMNAEGNIDYGDLPYLAHRALDELGPKALSDKLLNTRVFGLDEAQDATTINASLFQKTLSHMQDVGINPRVFVGMDRMQSLMQGLGGIDKEQVLGAFQGMLGVSNIHQLTKNFRSDAGTVALNNALLQHPLLKGRAMSPEQVPVNQNMGKPIDFSGLAKSQPTMYKNMFHSMMKASGISLGNVATNIAQGKHALDGMDWSNGGTKPSQVPAILSSRRQQKLFAQVAKQELQGSGLSRGDAAKAYSQMFRRNMPGKLTSRADREQAKTQFPVIRVGGSRSFEFEHPHVDVSRIEGWAANNDETARDYLSNVFTANSRTAQGGQLHVFAASHPFSRQQQNYYAQNPDSLVESSPGADPGLVSLTGGPQGEAVRHSALNAFEHYNGQYVPAEFSGLLQRQHEQISTWQGQGLLPSRVVNSTLASGKTATQIANQLGIPHSNAAPPPRVTHASTGNTGPLTINTPNVQVNMPNGGKLTVNGDTVNRGNTPPISAPSPVTSVPAGTGATVGNTPLFTGQPIGPMNGRSRPGSMGMTPYSGNAGMAAQVGGGAPPTHTPGGGSFGKFSNDESNIGHSLARIGGELQYLGQLGGSIIDATIKQGSDYRKATVPLGVSGDNGTQGFFDFSSSSGGINAYSHNTLPMYSNTRVAQGIQDLTGMTNTSFSQSSTLPALTDIMGLSAMTGISSQQLMGQMTGIQGTLGGNVLGGIPNMTGMLSGLYGNNLTEGNVSPTLSALQSALPTVQGLQPGGSGGMAQVMAFYKLALQSGMTSNNLGGVSDVLGSLSSMGNTPNLQQQYTLGQLFGNQNLTAAPELAQYQSQQTNEAQALAVNRLQQNIGGGLSLPNLQIKISQANIQMQQAQLTMSEAQLQASTVQQQQSQLQQNYNVASFNEQQSIANQTYGQIGQDSSRTAYFSWLRSQNAAQYNGTSPEVATQFQSAPTFGLQNAEFYAGLEHQRTQMVLSRSPLLSDMAFQENNKYINQQEAFYQAQLKLTNQQRSFELDWQPKLLAGNQKVLDVNKSMLGIQAQELGVQQQQFVLAQKMAVYEQKSDAITQQYLKQQGDDLANLMGQQHGQLIGLGPVGGKNVQPDQIIQALAKQSPANLKQTINRMGLPTDQQQTLMLLVQQLQKGGSMASIEKQLNGKGDKALQGNLQKLINSGAFADAQTQAATANAALNYGGTGAQWTALITTLGVTNKSMEVLATTLAPSSSFVLAIEKLANVLGPLATAIASVFNIIGLLKAVGGGGGLATGLGNVGKGIGALSGTTLGGLALGAAGMGATIWGGIQGWGDFGHGINLGGALKNVLLPGYNFGNDAHQTLQEFQNIPALKAKNDKQWAQLIGDKNSGWDQFWGHLGLGPDANQGPQVKTHGGYKAVPYTPGKQETADWTKWWRDRAGDWNHWWGDRNHDWNKWWNDRATDWKTFWNTVGKWLHDTIVVTLGNWKDQFGRWLTDRATDWSHWWTDRSTDWGHWWNDRGNDWKTWWADRSTDFHHWLSDIGSGFHGIIKTISDDFSKLFDPKKGLLGKVLGIFGGNSGGAMGEAGPSVISHGGFITPNVNADFHQKMNYGIHQGVDFQAAQGTPLEAFDGGKIVGSGFYPWGGEIDVDIGAGLIERYLHLSLLGAQVGQQVRKGQRIGLTGGGTPASGLGYWSSGAHSHVQIDQGDINAGLNPWPIWAMMGDNNISQYYNGSGVLDGPTTGARVHAGGARLSSSERMHHLSEGGIAMTRMRTELAEREPEAVVPLSKLASVLNARSSGSTVPSNTTHKAITISKIAERLELHVHTTAQKLDEQAQDDLMAQLLDIFKNAIEDMNGKST